MTDDKYTTKDLREMIGENNRAIASLKTSVDSLVVEMRDSNRSCRDCKREIDAKMDTVEGRVDNLTVKTAVIGFAVGLAGAAGINLSGILK